MTKEKPAKKNHKTGTYTVTEVGTLLEGINDAIKRIAEGHTGLDQRMEKLEAAVRGNSQRLDRIELRLSSDIAKLDGRLAAVETAR